MEIRVDTPSEAFTEVIHALASAPESRPRGVVVREIPECVSVIIERPYGFVACDGRTFNHAISAVEGMSLIGQCSVPELQTDRVRVLTSFQSGSVFRGAYGPRIEGSLDDLVALLKRDPDSRQAVLSIYNAQRDLGRWGDASLSGDVPCTLSIQFLIRQFRLHMWVTMRSNDAWKGTPYDLGQFGLLQAAVAQALDVDIGRYTHSVGSLHLYESDYEKASKIGAPVNTAYIIPRFGGDGSIESTTSRCRRMLLGHVIEVPSYFESQLISLL